MKEKQNQQLFYNFSSPKQSKCAGFLPSKADKEVKSEWDQSERTVVAENMLLCV